MRRCDSRIRRDFRSPSAERTAILSRCRSRRTTNRLAYCGVHWTQAKVDGGEKLEGFRRLDRFVRVVEERLQPAADFDAVISHERAISPSVGGRSVKTDKTRPSQQLSLF